MELNRMLIGCGVAFIVVIVGIIKIMFWYKKPKTGTAIVITGAGGMRISFEKGIFVIPVMHRFHVVDLTNKQITIDYTGNKALVCKDKAKIETKIIFYVRVNKMIQDISKVASNFSAEKTFEQKAIEKHFAPIFKNAILELVNQFTAQEVSNERDQFKNYLFKIIGNDLNGYYLDDISIDRIKIK